MTLFTLLVAVVAFFAGAIAAVSGFGIGSILTPLLTLQIGVKMAVPAAAVAHFVGSVLRFWTLRDRVDRKVLWSFGVMSAAGAFAGALIHVRATPLALRTVLAVILIVAGGMGLFGVIEHIRFGRVGAWIAGGVSGLLGGLIGNQGGIRAAAMLAFNVPKEAFVATAVAIALVVDGARMPVYLVNQGPAMLEVWPLIVAATIGVVLGTWSGKAIFGRIPADLFRRMVSALLVALGVAILSARG